jgi:hypothetical protein
MKQLIWQAALAAVVSTGCKAKSAEPGAPAPVIAAPAVANDAAPPSPDAAARLTTRTAVWGIDVASAKTLTQLRTLGLRQGVDETDVAREPLMTGQLFDVDADKTFTVAAHVPSKGASRDAADGERIHWIETRVNPDLPPPSLPDATSGLCVENVCIGAPVSEASRFAISSCDAYRREMEFHFKCAVPGSPMSIIVREPFVKGAKDGKPFELSQLIEARKSTAPAGPLTITAFAWEVIPGSWQPLQGCTDDCD